MHDFRKMVRLFESNRVAKYIRYQTGSADNHKATVVREVVNNAVREEVDASKTAMGMIALSFLTITWAFTNKDWHKQQ